MNELTIIKGNGIAAQQSITAGLFERFIAYIDAQPKTIETYTKALRQLFNYFSLNGITHPQREDIIAFREELKASGHKPTTVQNYITATRLFFNGQQRKTFTPT